MKTIAMYLNNEMRRYRIMLNIEPINNNITNYFIPVCTENVLSTYLEYMGYEYQNIFAYSLNFYFSKFRCTSGRVADGLHIEYNCCEWLRKLYGIYIKREHVECLDTLINDINISINIGNPVIIHLDSYYLPWSTLYYKEHTQHLVIVIDINSDKSIIKVLDSIEDDNYFYVSKEILKYGCDYIWKVTLPNIESKINIEEFDIQILNGQEVLIPKNRLQMLEDFSKVFVRIFNPDLEFRDKYNLGLMRTEKIVDDFRKMILQINLFCKWMIWRDEIKGIKSFKPVLDIYMQIMSKLNVFVNLLYKNCILGWKKSFNIDGYNIIVQVIELEKKAYDRFVECIMCKHSKQMEPFIAKDGNRHYIIPLDDIMDNKGFCLDVNERVNEDLTGVGEYFVVENMLGDAHSMLSIEYSKKFDNVVCRGQEIEVFYKKNTSKLLFLACAEWGAVDEEIVIVGNSEIQYLSIHIHDLSQVNGNRVYLRGKTYDLKGNVIQKEAAVFLYSIQYKETYVKKIKLPNSLNVHLMAMELIGE